MQSLDLRAARRYAGALFNVALKRDEVDEVLENLVTVTDVATKSPELMAVLHHPRITRERKKELLHKIFEGNVRTDVEHFLFLLIEKDRAPINSSGGAGVLPHGGRASRRSGRRRCDRATYER